MRFWLRQGLHASAHCQPSVRAALRKIDQSARRGFANSISMAMELPARRGAAVQKVLRRIALEYLLYEESGATCWDTMIDVRKRPEWLKVLGVGLWSRVATPTPTPTLNRNPTLTLIVTL